MRSLTVRPQLSFTALLAFLAAVESAVLASRAYALHPLPIAAAITFDLCTMPALAWWLLVVRRGLARPRTVARVAIFGGGTQGLRLGVIGSANLRLVLREPVELHGIFGIRRSSKELLLKVDDPEGLAAALKI